MKKRISFVALLALLLACMGTAVMPLTAASPNDDYYHGERTNTVVWNPQSDNGKYPQHRIPGIVVTKKDTVIIYCEARTGDTSHSLKKAHDWCLMDIYIQRSEDGGKTFGEPIYITKGDRTTACVNNPVMIVGNDNTLHMLYCKNYSVEGGGMWYRKSTDDGLTWTPEREITGFAESVPHDCFAFGPTHGISTRNGVLMSPVWLVLKGTGREGKVTDHGPSVGYVFYSKDNGETWQLSDRTNKNIGEMCIAELSDGSITLNSRATGYRKVTTSPNGINGWTTTYADEQLPDPACCGGMVAVDLPGLPYAHLFVNCANLTDRADVTLRVSFDDCVKWEQSIKIDEYFGGYCDVAVDSKGKVYVLYEKSMGVQVKLFTCSFADEFLANADDKRISNQSEFLFNSEAALSLTGSVKNLEESISEESLHLVATQTKKHSFLLDIKSETQNLNLTRTPIMALKMRVNASVEGDMKLGGYVKCGRIDSFTKEKYWSATVPNNGEWQTVLVNMGEFGIEGRLDSMRLELFSDTLTCGVGDSVDLAFVKFYSNEADAREALGLTSTVPNEGNPNEAPNTNGSLPDEKGCKSSASEIFFGIAVVTAVIPAVWKRKKD
ncbi:MAG: exo-alpha-sialidase [Ruminococcaceae bacterium]|nr:exo-alpha-sialidase [Oscillospiraceae bacterium]